LCAESEKPNGKGFDHLVMPPARVTSTALLPCQKCDGAGFSMETVGDVEDLGGVYKKPCKKCNGRGKLVRERTPNEAIEAQQRQRTAFDTEQLKRGLVPIAAGYLPNDVLDSLTPSELALIAHHVPEACTKCYGLGFIECSTCDGLGYREKKAPLQKNSRKSSKSKIKKDEELIQEPCSKCLSSGRRPCKPCNSQGLKPLCKRCAGSGVVKEKKKIRTEDKTYKTVVEDVSCKSCKGYGRK
jgi:DnaJ-class molecular chaperone